MQVLQSLMLNPVRRKAQVFLGAYAAGISAITHNVTYDAALGRLNFTYLGQQIRGFVSAGLLAAIETFASGKYTTTRYRVSGRGVAATPVDTYVRPATPSGFNVGESLPGGDLVFFRFVQSGRYGFRFANGKTGVIGSEIQIPASAGTPYQVDGDHVVSNPNVAVAEPVRQTFATDNSGRSYSTFAAVDNAAALVAYTASSAGLVTSATNVPFQLSGGTLLTRAFNLTSGDVAHLPGALRVAVTGSTVEVVDDGENGGSAIVFDGATKKNVSRATRTVRIARTAFVGVLNIAGGSAGLEIHSIAKSSRAFAMVTYFDGDPTRFFDASGGGTGGFDVTDPTPSQPLIPIILTRTGLFSSRRTGGHAWSDGNTVSNLNLPFTPDASTFFSVYGIDAIAGRTSASSSAGFISLNHGTSWSPVTFYASTTVGGALTATSSPPKPVTPLLP